MWDWSRCEAVIIGEGKKGLCCNAVNRFFKRESDSQHFVLLYAQKLSFAHKAIKQQYYIIHFFNSSFSNKQ